MRTFSYRAWITTASIVCLSFAALAHADTLLVISDSEDMYGSTQMTSAMEHFGAELVATGLQNTYRKTYQYVATDGVPFQVLWQTILNERQPGESIDVFSMEHGPNDAAIDQLDDQSKIPAGFVRRFFSTACEDWGDFTAKADGSGFQQQDFNDAIHANLRSIGAQEYILHANTNGSGLLEIPYLVHEFQNGNSWILGAARAFDHMDSLLAPLIPNFEGMNAGDDEFLDWRLLLISRPVLGGSDLAQILPQIGGRNMLASSTEFMPAPNASLAQALETNCPDVFGSDDLDTSLCSAGSTQAGEPKAIQAAATMLEKLFEVYGTDDNGCVSHLAPFQGLLNRLFKRRDGVSPSLESLCVERDGNNDVSFKLSLGPTPEAQAFVLAGMNADNERGMDHWEIVVPQQLFSGNDAEVALSALQLERDITIRVHGSASSTSIDIDGLGASMTFSEEPGIVKPLTQNIGIDGFTLKGETTAIRLAAPILNIPVSFTDGGGGVQKVSVLGIPIPVDMGE